ncbi:prolyl hydroxylase family protein [Colwellia sp. MEBiC06753]
MSLQELLELKHVGQLTLAAVIKQAQTNKQFAEQWLIHVLRSEVGIDEVLLAASYAVHWQVPALAKLNNYLASLSISSECEDDIALAIKSNQTLIEGLPFDAIAPVAASIWQLIIKTPSSEQVDEHIAISQTDIAKSLTEEIQNDVLPLLRDVTLFGDQGAGSKNQSIRNNSQFLTPLPNTSIELAIIERLTANVVGLAMKYAEPPVVLRYLPGEYYKWHYDHIYPHNESIQAQLNQFGQRIRTGLFNLNDNFTGGETQFKQPHYSITPKHGQIISFANVDAQHNRLIASIHRGSEVTSGEKWVMTLWFRDKPFWLRQGLLTQ